MKKFLLRYIAIPQDHGSWVFLLSPLLIGLFAGGNWSSASAFLIIAALAGFLIRQPTTIVVKTYTGRRSRRDLPAAFFWISIYSIIGMLALGGLILLGYQYILLLGLPGILVFAWYLYLVSQRSERHKIGVGIVASGVLALNAPAAYWVGVNWPDPRGWWLFILIWLQSAASIVYAYLRLNQRNLPETTSLSTRISLGRRALLYTTFNLLFVLVLSISGVLPILFTFTVCTAMGRNLMGNGETGDWCKTNCSWISPAIYQHNLHHSVYSYMVLSILIDEYHRA
ncbi:MAG: YwiC-like family protein [Anaerolineales bacterium]